MVVTMHNKINVQIFFLEMELKTGSYRKIGVL